MNESQFRIDLERIINTNSMENGSNTPDFILAGYRLEAFDVAVTARDQPARTSEEG